VTLLAGMPPAQYQGWQLLFRLEELGEPWVLVGGQLIALLAAEHDVALPRQTLDVDVLMDVRAAPGSIRRVAEWLAPQGLEFDGASSDNIGHRFSRPGRSRPGNSVGGRPGAGGPRAIDRHDHGPASVDR